MELVVVIVVLGILGAVAMPKFVDFSSDAKTAADKAAIGGIQTALAMSFMQHRLQIAPSGQWITTVGDVASVMQANALPEGIVISGAKLEDQRGNTYTFVAETISSPATITLDVGGGGGGGGS